MTLLNVKENFVKCIPEGLVSVWHVTEVSFDPFSVGWYVEGESLGAVVGDL